MAEDSKNQDFYSKGLFFKSFKQHLIKILQKIKPIFNDGHLNKFLLFLMNQDQSANFTNLIKFSRNKEGKCRTLS